MYTTCAFSGQTIAGNYEKWLQEHQDDEIFKNQVGSLLEAAIKEACEYDAEIQKPCKYERNRYDIVKRTFPQSELIKHVDHMASFCVKYKSGIGDCDLAFYSLLASNCINCVLFSLLFHGEDIALMIEPKYLKEYQWENLRDILPYTNLKKIFIRIDDYMYIVPIGKYYGRICGKLWNVISDEYFVAVEEPGPTVTCVESGMPMEMETFRCRYYKIPETVLMKSIKEQWKTQPRASREETFFGFYKKYFDRSTI